MIFWVFFSSSWLCPHSFKLSAFHQVQQETAKMACRNQQTIRSTDAMKSLSQKYFFDISYKNENQRPSGRPSSTQFLRLYNSVAWQRYLHVSRQGFYLQWKLCIYIPFGHIWLHLSHVWVSYRSAADSNQRIESSWRAKQWMVCRDIIAQLSGESGWIFRKVQKHTVSLHIQFRPYFSAYSIWKRLYRISVNPKRRQKIFITDTCITSWDTFSIAHLCQYTAIQRRLALIFVRKVISSSVVSMNRRNSCHFFPFETRRDLRIDKYNLHTKYKKLFLVI